MIDDLRISIIHRLNTAWDVSQMSPRDPAYYEALEDAHYEMRMVIKELLNQSISFKQLEELKNRLEFEDGCG